MSPPRPVSRLLLLFLLPVLAGCNPLYVARAGVEQARILAARTPIPEAVRDPELAEDARGKLLLVLEARDFAQARLGLDVGDAYTTFVQLRSDTLSHIVSAAHRDRLEARTWWFPVVGRVPYRGYFRIEEAQAAALRLEEEGFDTWVRPTSAYSTLGWFSDPVFSSMLRGDAVSVIETVFHEMAHRHLYVPGNGRFNESFATWVGNAAAIAFFCGRTGGGEDTVWCARARDRWHDDLLFSRFIDALVSELRTLYARTELTEGEILAGRASIFDAARQRFRNEVQPTLRSGATWGFLTTPLNNATLLSRMVYYHRLPDFARFQEGIGGDPAEAIRTLGDRIDSGADPFEALRTP